VPRPASEIFRAKTSATALSEIFDTYLRHSRAIGQDGVAAASLEPDLEHVVNRLSQRMRTGQHTFTTYRQKLASKGAEKFPRVISIPTARDRIVLKALSLILAEVFEERRTELPTTKVDRLIAAIQTQGFDSFIRLDIRDFYPSISHQLITRSLRSRIRKREIIQLILSACSTRTVPQGKGRPDRAATRGIPQGLSLSNIVAEICLSELDHLFLNQQKCSYFRYVDDIIILCREKDVMTLLKSAETKLKKLELDFHDPTVANSKSGVGRISKGFDYLGYTFTETQVSVRHPSVRKIEQSILKIFTGYKHASARNEHDPEHQERCLRFLEWRLNLNITGCIFENQRRGWLSYFSRTNDLYLLNHLDRLVAKCAASVKVQKRIRIKKFSTALFRLRLSQDSPSRYVPNFDKFTPDEKRTILRDVLVPSVPHASSLPDDIVMALFAARIQRVVHELEHDLQELS
jgi:RNA-directed DNA polymerase